MTRFALFAAVVAGVAAFGSSGMRAEAATQGCTGGSGGSATTYTLLNALNAECFSGNDTNTIDANFLLFGETGWTLADKNDDANSGDGSILFTSVGPDNGQESGNWGITAPAVGFDVVITLVAGNNFGAFLIDLDEGLTGMWTASRDLSHASIYYRDGGGTIDPIPLPAAAWLLLSGIGGLGAMGWRKRRATI